MEDIGTTTDPLEASGHPFRRAPFTAGPVAAFRLQLAARSKGLGREALEPLPLVGGMSSIPSRAAILPRVLDSVVPQLDRLHLFLHGYDTVPEGIARPNLSITLASADHPYRASGKFLALSSEPAPFMFFGFDDDIIYSAGHVKRLRSALLRYGGHALVGILGHVFRENASSFTRDRRTSFFPSGKLVDEVVDTVGAGTCAFVSTVLPVDPATWRYGDMDDLSLAIEAELLGIPRIAVARPKGSLRPIPGSQKHSLWSRAKHDETRHNAEMMRLLALMSSRAQ